MVTLTEVEDEHFQTTHAGADVDDDDYTDTGPLPPHIIAAGDRKRLELS
jgi:hypothetical protein